MDGTDDDRVYATGNVTFSAAACRITADRAEFNRKTRLGTFYNAAGATMALTDEGRKTADMFGGQEPDV